MSTKNNFKLNWKYALGEVLLIFIGISLAIGFQNSNDARKDRKKVNGYLATIADNVASDSLEILRFVQLSEQKAKSGEAYIKAIRENKPELQAFMGGLSQLEEEYLNINDNGFEGLKASGYLSNIQGTNIEEALFNYYSYFDEVHESESSQNQYIEAQELEFVKGAASTNFMIMVTDIYLNKREPILNAPEQQMLKEVFDHPSLISINLRVGFIHDQYKKLLDKGIELRSLINTRTKK